MTRIIQNITRTIPNLQVTTGNGPLITESRAGGFYLGPSDKTTKAMRLRGLRATATITSVQNAGGEDFWELSVMAMQFNRSDIADPAKWGPPLPFNSVTAQGINTGGVTNLTLPDNIFLSNNQNFAQNRIFESDLNAPQYQVERNGLSLLASKFDIPPSIGATATVDYSDSDGYILPPTNKPIGTTDDTFVGIFITCGAGASSTGNKYQVDLTLQYAEWEELDY